jgi:hypothetical protein
MDLIDFVIPAAALASLVMLLTKSKLFSWWRNICPDWFPAHCPVCFSFWACAPFALHGHTFADGFAQYLALVTFSNLFMFGIAKLYLAIDDMDYTPE